MSHAWCRFFGTLTDLLETSSNVSTIRVVGPTCQDFQGKSENFLKTFTIWTQSGLVRAAECVDICIQQKGDLMEQSEIDQPVISTAPVKRHALVSLRPIHLVVLFALAGAGVYAAVLLTSQSVDDRGRQLLASQKAAHEAALKEIQDSAAAKDKEIESLTQDLKASYEKHKELLTKNQELDAKVKAFQGSLNVTKGQVLPSPGSTLPINVSPVFQVPEAPLIKDGSRLFAMRPEGIFTVQAPPASLKDLAAGQLKIPEAARVLAAKPAPKAGSVKMLFPEREFADSAKPTIKWQRQKGMLGGVQCLVLDKDGKVVARSEATTEEAWSVSQDLPRGHSYTLRLVSPNPAEPDAGRILSESTFYLLSESESAALAKKLTEAGDSSLLRCAAYAETGLLSSAEWEAGKFAKAQPNAAIGTRVLSHIKSLRPKR